MLGRRSRLKPTDVELDITSFMNLMIVLVPVLLMMMVFSRITVVELSLPGLTASDSIADMEKKQLEILVDNQGVAVFYPAGYLVKALPANNAQQDWQGLQTVLKQLKQTLLGKGVQKRDVTLLLNDDVPYQQVISLLDTTRSYKDVVAASVVDAELFPDVAFADVPNELKQPQGLFVNSEAGGAQ